MERKNRTGIDFSKHVHTVEIFLNKDNPESTIRVDHFKIPNTRMDYIQFINTDEIMSVTGDFGNWIFSRPFIPSAKNSVSDGYWLEKLRDSSCQEAGKYDSDETAKEIQELIDTGLEDYGYEDDELIKAKEYFQELLEHTDDENDYIYHAYYDTYCQPNFIDNEMIPFAKKLNNWLSIIFDAFDEICNRLEFEEENRVNYQNSLLKL